MSEQNKGEIPQKRTTVYLPLDWHNQLKAKLASKGLTISEWFRRLVRKELYQNGYKED